MKSRCLFFILVFIASSFAAGTFSFAQPRQSTFGYSISKQRLQFKLTTSFVFFSMQGILDMDSCAILVSEGEHLPYSLYYDEDFANGADNKIKKLLQQGS